MANKYVTVAGAGSKIGTSWANAFGFAEFITDTAGTATPGDNYWIEGGTYTLIATFNAPLDGTIFLHIRFWGVNSGTTNEPPTVSDLALGVNRPLFSSSSYSFLLDNYWDLLHLRFEFSSVALGCQMDATGTLRNTSIKNTYNSAAAKCIDLRSSGYHVFDCEFECTYGFAVDSGGTNYFARNYFHDCNKGILHTGANSIIRENIFDTCTIGEDVGAVTGIDHEQNTYYNCTTGIAGTTSAENTILNNTFSNCVDGIDFTSVSIQKLINYNNYYNNTTDVTGITKGPNALSVNPQFTDAPNGDFSLSSASALIGAALGIKLGVG